MKAPGPAAPPPTPSSGRLGQRLPDAPLRVLIDGVPGDSVSVLDRGLHYGDGLFETILARDGRCCQLSRHLARLARGADRLGLGMPEARALEAELAAAASGVDAAVLKLILTRGAGGRGYRPTARMSSRRALLVYPLDGGGSSSTPDGIAARICRTPASVNPALAGIKHLNRLDSVLARSEWTDPAVAEGVMLDTTGALVGGTMTNLFLWDGTRLLTPILEASGIAGTIRELTLELAARMRIDCVATRLGLVDLDRARGLFFTNAVVGVWPAKRLEGRDFDLGELPWDFLQAVHTAAKEPG